MTTATITEQDIAVLMDLMEELSAAGRREEVLAVAHAYTLACSVLYPWLAEGVEDDEELARDIEEAERDFAAGRWISQDEMERQLTALDDV